MLLTEPDDTVRAIKTTLLVSNNWMMVELIVSF
jgi:hypothetical protein